MLRFQRSPNHAVRPELSHRPGRDAGPGARLTVGTVPKMSGLRRRSWTDKAGDRPTSRRRVCSPWHSPTYAAVHDENAPGNDRRNPFRVRRDAATRAAVRELPANDASRSERTHVCRRELTVGAGHEEKPRGRDAGVVPAVRQLRICGKGMRTLPLGAACPRLHKSHCSRRRCCASPRQSRRGTDRQAPALERFRRALQPPSTGRRANRGGSAAPSTSNAGSARKGETGLTAANVILGAYDGRKHPRFRR